MTESVYTITATFVGGDKVSAGFKKIQDDINRTTKALTAAMQQQTQAIGSAATAIQKFTADTSKIRAKALDDASRGTRKLQEEQLKAIQEVSTTLKKSYDEDAARRKQQEEAEKHNWAERVNKTFEAAEKIKSVWKETTESLNKYAEAGMKVAEAQDRIKSFGFKSDELAHISAGIQHVVTTTKGLRESDVSGAFASLYQGLGSIDKALEHLEQASEYQFAMKVELGDKFTPEQLQEQAAGGFEFLEKAGLAENKEQAEQYFDVLTRITRFTHGGITAASLTPLLGGLSLKGLSPEGLMTMALAVKEMGTSSTALGLALGKIQTGAGLTLSKDLEQMGLGGAELSKSLTNNPLEFAETLRKGLSKKGIDPGNVGAVAEELKKLFGGLKDDGANAVAQFIKLSDSFGGDETAIKRLGGAHEAYGEAVNSVKGRIDALKAAQENFHATVGIGVLATYGRLASHIELILKPLTDFLMLHPLVGEMAGGMLLLGKVTAATAQSMAFLRLAGFKGISGLASVVEAEGSTAKSAAYNLGYSMGANVGKAMGISGKLAILTAIAGLADVLAQREAGVAAAQQSGNEANDLEKRIEELRNSKEIPAEQREKQITELEQERASRQIGQLSIGVKKDKALGIIPYWSTDTMVDLSTLSGYGWSHPVSWAVHGGAGGAEDRIEAAVASLRFKDAGQLSLFLAQAKKALEAVGAGDMLPALRHATLEAYKGGFAKKEMSDKPKDQAGNTDALKNTTSALVTTTGAIKENTAALSKEKNKSDGTKSGKTVPGAAAGGYILRTGLVVAHSGEEIRPASLVRRPQSLHAGYETTTLVKAQSSHGITIHDSSKVTITVHGGGNPREVAAAVEETVTKLISDKPHIISRAMDKRLRDRNLMT